MKALLDIGVHPNGNRPVLAVTGLSVYMLSLVFLCAVERSKDGRTALSMTRNPVTKKYLLEATAHRDEH